MPNGKLNISPMNAPVIESAVYFTRYNPLIFKLLIPIAFITPISRNSSANVKVIVKRKMINAIIIKIILTTRIMPVTTISKI